MENTDQSIYTIILIGFFLMIIMTAFIVFMIYAHRQRQIQNKQKLLAIQLEFEKTLLDVEKEIREETLSFVGRELHDNIGQLLSLAKLNLSSSKPEKIHAGKSLINEIIQEVRGLSKVLNLDWVDGLSLEAFIQKELQKLDDAEFCKTSFHSDLGELQVSKEEKIIMIRVIQECLNNAIKHANPTSIEIVISQNEQGKFLRITDDGVGFDSTEEKQDSGLVNLSKRMEMIGGKFQLSSSIGEGTSIDLLLAN